MATQAHGSDHSRDPRGDRPHPTPTAPLAHFVGRTRFIVLIAVAAVLLVAASLFVLGAWIAVVTVWRAFLTVIHGEYASAELTVELLEIVTLMLKAVVFYLIGVGFYSLFIGPLNVTTALGVETFSDLETKVSSIVIVILAVTFLGQFIHGASPNDLLLTGLAVGVVVAALVLFQAQSHRASAEQRKDALEVQSSAQRQLFHQDQEEREVRVEEVAPGRRGQTEEHDRPAGRPYGTVTPD